MKTEKRSQKKSTAYQDIANGSDSKSLGDKSTAPIKKFAITVPRHAVCAVTMTQIMNSFYPTL